MPYHALTWRGPSLDFITYPRSAGTDWTNLGVVRLWRLPITSDKWKQSHCSGYEFHLTFACNYKLFFRTREVFHP